MSPVTDSPAFWGLFIHAEDRDGNTESNSTWYEKPYNKIFFLKSREPGCGSGECIPLSQPPGNPDTPRAADLVSLFSAAAIWKSHHFHPKVETGTLFSFLVTTGCSWPSKNRKWKESRNISRQNSFQCSEALFKWQKLEMKVSVWNRVGACEMEADGWRSQVTPAAVTIVPY